MEKMMEVHGLMKSYGKVEAVRGIDFYVEKGKLFAFLGPNGAGKSTTIDILSTALKADQGTAVINGYSLGKEDSKIRSSIGVVFQGHHLDDLLTVRENLLSRGSFYGLQGKALHEAVEQAAQEAEVTDFLHRPYGKLSGGQRRRADIARALVNRPQILFLDEPTTGLDAQTRRNVWDRIHELQKEKGMTVFLTTHYMEEAASADYVIVIDHGKIAAKGTPAQLKQEYAKDQLRLWANDLTPVRGLVEEMALSYDQHADVLTITIPSTLEALPIIERVRDHIAGFEVLQGTMDDAFIGITGKEMR
ncbi:MAG TPA: ATP-binding cassette domain-containing protein [Firmicutes bacterium]|jgi:multidrug/hemolysin transport system ATP-binding protein|nr:ATP-binding cassette domain-containing protein [Bacillota bacterium]